MTFTLENEFLRIQVDQLGAELKGLYSKEQKREYLWQPGLRQGEPDMLLGKPLYTSAYMPNIAAGAKTILFGDLSYYWIGDRKGITFKRLNERYADFGQVGFLASKRVDAKLILPEAVKVLQQKASS